MHVDIHMHMHFASRDGADEVGGYAVDLRQLLAHAAVHAVDQTVQQPLRPTPPHYTVAGAGAVVVVAVVLVVVVVEAAVVLAAAAAAAAAAPPHIAAAPDARRNISRPTSASGGRKPSWS
eukprot:2794841-Rhodomonas_salina.1